MTAVKIILAVALLFFILSIFLFNGKGAWLIAGYNTASKVEKQKFDEKKICRAMGYLCVICSVMLCAMAYLGYRVESGMMSEDMMLWFGLLFAVVILVSVFCVIKYANTSAKKQD